MADYHVLSEKLQKQILEDRKDHRENPYAFSDADIVRRAPAHDIANLWRPAFVRDIEKSFTIRITTDIRIKHRYYRLIRMMTSQGAPCTYSWLPGSHGISGACWA